MESILIICWIIIASIIGLVIGIGIGTLWDYYNKREYYRTLRRNKKELEGNKK